ncbi:hypothetical protein HZC35_05535 [Candidatus Saganbacteria bacterium]|nr:hypothetical protein [Candidatus Saganbacteria bacterium]
MSAAGAMVVTGLEKELKLQRLDGKEIKAEPILLEKLVQKLNDATAIQSVKSHKNRQGNDSQKEENRNPKIIHTPHSAFRIARPFEWTQPTKSSGFWSFLIEWERKILNELLKFVIKPNVEELIQTAGELGLDLSGWQLETLCIDQNGEVLLLLQNELKILTIAGLVTDSYLARLVVFWRCFRLRQTLISLGFTDFSKLEIEAKRIAWLKLISLLKESHLKRVFSLNRRDFNKYSGLIKYYTRLALNVKVDLPQEAWIHQRLETLAREASRYQHELLESLKAVR